MSKVAQKERLGASGFTIVELVITIVAGSIVILGVYRLLAQAMWSYNLQEQMTDMYQNATFTIKKLSEEVSQAGGALPDSLYTVVYVTGSPTNDITMRVNKKGAVQKDTITITASAKIPIDSGNAFTGLDSIVVDTGKGFPVTKLIDSVKVTSTPDTVYLKSPATISLKPGDVVYAASTARYFIDNMNFCLNSTSNVMAENIDSLAMMFYDSTHAATTSWANMSSISLYVRARTAAPDKFYKHAVFHDGYRRLALSMNIKLRNRF